MEQYKAVKIYEPKDGLDEDALKSVLEQPSVKDKPLMLLSVAGAFRMGKSFLLTLFLRYLRNRGHIDDEWLGNEDINDGFSWKGGSAPDTQGILIWSEPFFVKDQQNQEVAVFLMDTQGMFDHDGDKALCTKIFAFSTLLSSVQVFNISNQIQENDLEYLQFFVDYAARTASSGEIKPFQRLMFLIRDWQSYDDHDFGLDVPTGGYLDGILKKGGSSDDVSSVREGIRKSFQTLDCFLMPEPGYKVSVNSKNFKFSGQIDVIDKEFLEYVGILAKCLFSPDRVVVKSIEGQTMNSTDFLNFAISRGRDLKNNAQPTPKSLLESIAEFHLLKAVRECKEKYDEAVKEAFKNFVSKEKVKSLHDNIVAKMEVLLQEKLAFGENEQIQKHKKQTLEWMKNKESIIRRMNNFLKVNMIYDMTEARVQLVEEYEEKVSKNVQLNECLWKEIKERFGKKYSSYPEYLSQKEKMEEAREMFHAATQEVLAQNRIIVGKNRVKLMKSVIFESDDVEYAREINELFDETFGTTSDLDPRCGINIRDLSMMKFQRTFAYLCWDLLEKYGRTMSEGMKDRHVTPEVMHEMHNILSKWVLNAYSSDNFLKEYNVGRVIRAYDEKTLQTYLDAAFRDYLTLNEINFETFMLTTRTVSGFIDTLGDAASFLDQSCVSNLVTKKPRPTFSTKL